MADDDTFVALYRDGLTKSDPDLATLIVFGASRDDLAERVSNYLEK